MRRTPPALWITRSLAALSLSRMARTSKSLRVVVKVGFTKTWIGSLKTLRSWRPMVRLWPRSIIPRSTWSSRPTAAQTLETLCCGNGRSPCQDAIQPSFTSNTATPTSPGKLLDSRSRLAWKASGAAWVG